MKRPTPTRIKHAAVSGDIRPGCEAPKTPGVCPINQYSIPKSQLRRYSLIVSALTVMTITAIAAVQIRIRFGSGFRDKSEKATPQSNIAVATFGLIGSAPGIIDLRAST